MLPEHAGSCKGGYKGAADVESSRHGGLLQKMAFQVRVTRSWPGTERGKNVPDQDRKDGGHAAQVRSAGHVERGRRQSMLSNLNFILGSVRSRVGFKVEE